VGLAYQIIGKPIPRRDARSKVLGQAKYTDDFSLPGMLFVKVLRSPLPHARIRSIKTTAARKQPGVVAVLTAKDIPAANSMGPIIKDQPVLCADLVRFAGDAVALVAAETEQAAEIAVERIEVDYEELPAVTDPLEALEPGAPVAHEGGNIGTHMKVRRGDIEAGFRNAAAVVEGRFITPRVEHAYMEPEIAVVATDAQGDVTVWSSTQHAHLDREEVSRVLGLPQSRVRVHQMMTGGGFGGKLNPHAQCYAALVAWKTGRPARVHYHRDESLMASHKAHPFVIDMKLGAGKDGKLLAIDARLVGNTGAYLCQGRAVITKAGSHVSGVYYCPNIKADSFAVYTNTVPCGAMRGYGVPQVTFALESLMDELADRLGLDPVELRLRNALDTTVPNATGQIMPASIPVKEMLARAKASVQSLQPLLNETPPGKKRGIGVGCSSRGIGSIRKASRSTAVVSLHPDGSATVACGSVDLGQGSDTMMAQVAAEELGLDVDRIRVVTNDTAVSPDCESTSASRVTYVSGNAVRFAAAKVKARVLELASREFGCSPEEVKLKNGVVAHREQGLSLATLYGKYIMHTITDVAENLPPTTPPDPETGQGSPAGTYNFNVHVALVEVDEGTGKIDTLHYRAMGDVGQMLNPMAVEGQMYGGVMMGMGYTLSEDVLLDKGVANRTFGTYLIPTTCDLPHEFLIDVIEDPEPTGPFGAKGFSEGSLDPVGATMANAVSKAIGVRVARLPMTSERVYQLLQQRKQQ
jgi:CO/xanthine dehydrogenase Mo-binding subunit